MFALCGDLIWVALLVTCANCIVVLKHVFCIIMKRSRIALMPPGCVLHPRLPVQLPSFANSRHKTSQLHLCQASPFKEHWHFSTASNQPDSPMQPRGPWPNGRVANACLARDFESNPRSHLSEQLQHMRQLLSTYENCWHLGG